MPTSGKTTKAAVAAVAAMPSIPKDMPRGREGSFEPVLIPKHDRRFTDLDDKILATCARGMTVRESQGFLRVISRA